MGVFDAVRTVRAVREFQDKPLPPDAARRVVGTTSPAAPRTAPARIAPTDPIPPPPVVSEGATRWNPCSAPT